MTYCSPVREAFLKREQREGCAIDLCRYIRIQKGFSVYALYGESADAVFTEQAEKLMPYLHQELSRMFEQKYRSDAVAHMKLLLDMQAEMKDLILPDFAFYQYWKENLEQALAFLEYRVQSLRQTIADLTYAEERLGKAYYDELCAYYQTQIDETLTYARRMAQCDPLLSEEICQRVGQSAAVCGGLQTFQGLLTVSPVCTFPVCSLKTAHSCDKMAAFSF